MLLILDDLKYKWLKFTNQRMSHSLLSIPCSVNDAGVLHETISQGWGALSLRAKSKILKELSLSSAAHDANKDLLSLESTKTSLVFFFALVLCCCAFTCSCCGFRTFFWGLPRSLSAISFSRSSKDRSSFSSSPVTSTITSSLVFCLFAIPWSWCLRKNQVCRFKPPCWKENRNWRVLSTCNQRLSKPDKALAPRAWFYMG